MQFAAKVQSRSLNERSEMEEGEEVTRYEGSVHLTISATRDSRVVGSLHLNNLDQDQHEALRSGKTFTVTVGQ